MSNETSIWGPVPPWVDLSEDQDAYIVGSVATTLILAILAVTLRLACRLSRAGPGLGIDDYAILVALTLGIGLAVACLISLPWGSGRHLWAMTKAQFEKNYYMGYAFVLVYSTCLLFTKSSILLFYRRVFGTSRVWCVVFALTVAHGTAFVVTWLAGCRPVSYYWRQYFEPDAEGSCINTSLFYLANGVIGLVMDVTILLVPVPIVFHLQMDKRNKIFVMGILLLGSFVCVASAVRIAMIVTLTRSQDIIWYGSRLLIWSCVEALIGIMCGCLPTMAPLVRLWFGKPSSSEPRGGSPRTYALISRPVRHHRGTVQGSQDRANFLARHSAVETERKAPAGDDRLSQVSSAHDSSSPGFGIWA